MTNKRILVIGKNSFVGKNFALKSKFQDINFISLRESKPEDIEYANYDIIIYLAAIVHQFKKLDESEYFFVNKELCVQTANLAKKSKVKQFIYLSTTKVYGSKYDNKIRNENSECYPDDVYGKSKYEAELELRNIEDNDFTVSIIRTPLVYGEGVKANVLKLIKLVDKFYLLPFAGINNKRSMTYVGNLVEYIDCIIDQKASGIFIAMDREPISTSDLVKLIAKNLNKKIRLFKLPDIFIKLGLKFYFEIFNRLFGPLEFNNEITNRKLEFSPGYTFEIGIKNTVKWYMETKMNNSKIQEN